MHVHSDRTRQGGLARRELIRAPEPAVPEVGGGVFGGGEEQGDWFVRVGGGRQHGGDGGGRVVFCGVTAEGFVEGCSVRDGVKKSGRRCSGTPEEQP